jgi:microcystin-dependent protein
MSGIVNSAGSRSGVISDTEMEHDFSGALDIVGMIAPFAMTSPPIGWLACDGSAVSRTVTYSALFAVLSTTWGTGDGSTTFNLPDLEGAFLRGTGSHGTSNMANGNDFAGPSVGSFEVDQAQDHRHHIMTDGGAGIGTNNIGANAAYRQVTLANNDYNEWVVAGNPSTNNSQGTPRVGDETMPFNAGVKYCIKY